MGEGATYLRSLIVTAHALNLDADLAKIVGRLTTITGPQDPQLNQKLAALPPAAELVVAQQLASLLVNAP